MLSQNNNAQITRKARLKNKKEGKPSVHILSYEQHILDQHRLNKTWTSIARTKNFRLWASWSMQVASRAVSLTSLFCSTTFYTNVKLRYINSVAKGAKSVLMAPTETMHKRIACFVTFLYLFNVCNTDEIQPSTKCMLWAT